MGNISSGIRTIAERRADIFRTVEKTTCETTEASVDDAVTAAAMCVKGDISAEPTTTVDIDELMAIVPDQADEEHDREIANILASDEDIVGLDDILGLYEDDDIGALI